MSYSHKCKNYLIKDIAASTTYCWLSGEARPPGVVRAKNTEGRYGLRHSPLVARGLVNGLQATTGRALPSLEKIKSIVDPPETTASPIMITKYIKL